MAWVDAEKYCVGNGANLASIHTPEDYQFIQEVVRGDTGRFSEAWIGGNDAVKDYVWLWSDGSVFNFHDWDVHEPDNNYNREKCVVMNITSSGGASCELSRPFVCGTRPL
ncbi:hypothetical protein VZT92_015165 [Zoarces viviparus]|uniref:C-type lectin domain-containing protein n=1 Tax=Zoarces viviparus TaxID=48416 RepID=A0AAW1EVP8_ZOAVI